MCTAADTTVIREKATVNRTTYLLLGKWCNVKVDRRLTEVFSLDGQTRKLEETSSRLPFLWMAPVSCVSMSVSVDRQKKWSCELKLRSSSSSLILDFLLIFFSDRKEIDEHRNNVFCFSASIFFWCSFLSLSVDFLILCSRKKLREREEGGDRGMIVWRWKKSST